MKKIVFAALLALPAHAETPLLSTCKLAGDGFVEQSQSYDKISAAFQNMVAKIAADDPKMPQMLSAEIVAITDAIVEGRKNMPDRLEAMKANCLP